MRSFRRDDRVFHTVHGAGLVVDADGRYTTIAFDDSAVRQFVTTLMQLQPSDLPLPPPPSPVRRTARERAKSQRTEPLTP